MNFTEFSLDRLDRCSSRLDARLQRMEKEWEEETETDEERKKNQFRGAIALSLRRIRVYGKARYSQTRRYSQIQNGLARPFNRTREGGFCTLAFNKYRKPHSLVWLNGESVLYLAVSAYLTVSGFSVHPMRTLLDLVYKMAILAFTHLFQ